MKPSSALEEHRAAVRSLAGRHHVANPRVSREVIEGRDYEGDALRLLVDPLPGASLFDLGGLQIDLEELLNVEVHVVTPSELPASLRDDVLREARPL